METTDDGSKTPKLPISYHTFIYPFTYENDLKKEIADSGRWTQIHIKNRDAYNSQDLERRLLEFNEYQYFLPKARSLLFDVENPDSKDDVKCKTAFLYKYGVTSDGAAKKAKDEVTDRAEDVVTGKATDKVVNKAAGKASYTIVKRIGNEFIDKESLQKEYNGLNGIDKYFATCYKLTITQLTLLLFPEFKTGIFTFELVYDGKPNYAYIDDSSTSDNYRELESQESDYFRKYLKKEETIEQQINIINNYGRRVGVPCLKAENNQAAVLINADRIIISGLGQDGEELSIDFNKLSHEYNKCGKDDLDIPTYLVSKILLPQEKKEEEKSGDKKEKDAEENPSTEEESVSDKRSEDKTKSASDRNPEDSKSTSVKKTEHVTLKPVLDDRMFTVCLYRCSDYLPLKKTFSLNLRNSTSAAWREQYGNVDTYRYLEPELYRDEAKMLYKFIFLEDSITCYDIHMLKDKLQEHVLGRWIELGTIHAATEYSLVCVTGEDESLVKSVINPFLTIYVDMVKLALAQRTIITNIEYKGQQISNSINTQVDSYQESESVLNDVEEVWQKYISFENQIYLPEVTFQEQGVEIYDILKRSMRIKELNDYVKEGLINLHNIATLKAERSRIKLEKAEQHTNDLISKNLNMLSIVGISLALITFVVNFISAGQMFLLDKETNVEKYWTLSVLQLIGIGVMLLILYFYYRSTLGAHCNKRAKKKCDADSSGNNKESTSTDNEAIITTDTTQNYIFDIWAIPLFFLFVGIFFIIILMPILFT